MPEGIDKILILYKPEKENKIKTNNGEIEKQAGESFNSAHNLKTNVDTSLF